MTRGYGPGGGSDPLPVERLIQISEAVARTETRLVDLGLAVDRMDESTIRALAIHARKINSLEISRGRIKGWIGGVSSLGVLGGIAGWFKWGG